MIAEDIIAVDGKSLCGSKRVNECKKALHIINAGSCANRICLGQLKVADKSNEIPAVPELLKLLYIKGAIVTLDAMGAQEETIKKVREAGADYVITLKGNQGDLHETVKDSFILHDNDNNVMPVYRADAEIIADHGRIDENAAVNFSWLRKFSLGLLKNESSFKASIRRKQRKVCTSTSYLAKVIDQI